MIDRNTLFGPTSRLAGLQRRFERVIHARTARLGLRTDRRDAPRILAALADVRPDARSWIVQGGRGGEPTILLVGPRAASPLALVRVARSPAGQAGLDRAAVALDELRAKLAGDAAATLLPMVIGRGTLPGRTWSAESALTGRSARSLLADADARRRLLVAASQGIRRIHARTARPTVGDDALVGRWVSTRVAIVAEALGRPRPTPPGGDPLAAVEALVAEALHGRTLDVGWIHGDLWPANLLVTRDTQAISGIVDWDSAEDGELALHDLLHLAVTTRRLVERKELGPVLAALLRGAAWTDDDRAVLDPPSGDAAGGEVTTAGGSPAGGSPALPDRAALWLYWLRFVQSNLRRHPDLAADRTWLTVNVEQVLACA